MSFSALQAVLLLDFQKPLRAEVWALRKQVSLPGLVSTPCLARVGALCAPGAQLTCVQSPVSVTVPGLVSCSAMAGPGEWLCCPAVCPLPFWDLKHPAAQPLKDQNHIGAG